MSPRNLVIGQKVSPAKVERAKELRRNMTRAEKALWEELRANRLKGWHFRRQQVIAGYIVDFYCHAAGLAVEVDGAIHQGQVDGDRQRDAALLERDVRVVRFSNQAVLEKLPEVLQQIEQACAEGSGR